MSKISNEIRMGKGRINNRKRRLESDLDGLQEDLTSSTIVLSYSSKQPETKRFRLADDVAEGESCDIGEAAVGSAPASSFVYRLLTQLFNPRMLSNTVLNVSRSIFF